MESVTIEEIAKQRLLGWPDFHPEDFCHLCGNKNPVWFASNELWNSVISSPTGILCPLCFTKLYEEKTGHTNTIWEFSLWHEKVTGKEE